MAENDISQFRYIAAEIKHQHGVCLRSFSAEEIQERAFLHGARVREQLGRFGVQQGDRPEHLQRKLQLLETSSEAVLDGCAW